LSNQITPEIETQDFPIVGGLTSNAAVALKGNLAF
jgi:hypothetical protein